MSLFKANNGKHASIISPQSKAENANRTQHVSNGDIRTTLKTELQTASSSGSEFILKKILLFAFLQVVFPLRASIKQGWHFHSSHLMPFCQQCPVLLDKEKEITEKKSWKQIKQMEGLMFVLMIAMNRNMLVGGTCSLIFKFLCKGGFSLPSQHGEC